MRGQRIETVSSRAIGILLALALASVVSPAVAALDLRNATTETLDNGLTLILLPDRRFPVVSVQMLYRVGARNERSSTRTSVCRNDHG